MLAKVEIKNICNALSEVIVDGQDLSNTLSAITYQHRAGETPKLILELIPRALDIVSNACEVKKEP